MLFIRCDGNSDMGMGHVMRCLSIADGARKLGEKAVFITNCKECIPTINERGYEARLISKHYVDHADMANSDNPLWSGQKACKVDMLSELDEFASIINENCSQVYTILIDSYLVNEDYYVALRSRFKDCQGQVKIACLEDMGNDYSVDLLINYNIYGESLKEKYTRARKRLLGARYMPLREEFLSDIEYQPRDKVTDVMITTGGGDPCFAAGGIIDRILRELSNETTKEQSPLEKSSQEDSCLKGISFHIVSGPVNSHRDELYAKYSGLDCVALHENVKCMKELIRSCDVVITATGSTIYEVSALGVPMIVFYYAKNQRQGAGYLEKHTIISNCGNFEADPDHTVENIVNALKRCITDKTYREDLYMQERSLVDTNGAVRIAKELLG